MTTVRKLRRQASRIRPNRSHHTQVVTPDGHECPIRGPYAMSNRHMAAWVCIVTAKPGATLHTGVTNDIARRMM